MDYRILFASFILVFLAELGDKTQLTALALSTSSRSPWAVFLGTSLALVAGSALAVLFGELIIRFLPLKVLHIASAVLFILMGVVLLLNIARKADYSEMEKREIEENNLTEDGIASAVSESGKKEEIKPLFRLIINQAAGFEESIIEYIDTLAASFPAGQKQDLLKEVIAEDRQHLNRIGALGEEKIWNIPHADGKNSIRLADLKQIRKSHPLHPGSLPDSKELEGTEDNEYNEEVLTAKIETAIEAEEGVAEFYLALARIAKIPSVREAFRALAMEDLDHARKLHSLIN